MSRTHQQRESIARRIFSAIPDVYGFRFLHFTDLTYFESENCVIRFGWERYETKIASIQFLDPKNADTLDGMSFWVLQNVLGFQVVIRDGADPNYELGMAIVNHCDDLLRGNFGIRKRYKQLEKSILDRALESSKLQ